MFWDDFWWVILAGMLAIPLVCVIAFGIWLRRQPNLDLETGAKCWDAFIKLVSAVTIVVGGAMMFGKYIDEQIQLDKNNANQVERDLALRESEFLRQILEFDIERHKRQRALLTEAKILAARISSTPNPEQSDLTRFEELFFADLIGIEEPQGDVEGAMIQFRRKLKKPQIASENSLYQLSLDLSRAVETELMKSEKEIQNKQGEIYELLKPKG